MKNEEYYIKENNRLQARIATAENITTQLRAQNYLLKSRNEVLNADKSKMEEKLHRQDTDANRSIKSLTTWNKTLLAIVIFLIGFVCLLMYYYTEKNNELFETVEKSKRVPGPTEKLLARADSIFGGVYCLYPTDTAVMTVGNGYGDTLKVMITNLH